MTSLTNKLGMRRNTNRTDFDRVHDRIDSLKKKVGGGTEMKHKTREFHNSTTVIVPPSSVILWI